MAKSDKMYSKSPKIEKDEKGKPAIKKPTDAAKTDMGLKGGDLEGAGKGMPIDVCEQERVDMGKKHVDELKDMHKRHSEEIEKMQTRHAQVRANESKSETKTKESE